jgi:hypothetical protein
VMAGAARFLRGAADNVISRTAGFGLMDDVLEEGAEKFLTKNAVNHAGHAISPAVMNAASNMRIGGLVNEAHAEPAFDIMAGLDTSNVPGGSVIDRVMANQNGNMNTVVNAPRSGLLQDVTMGLRDVERRLNGSVGSLLFPIGLTEYLEAVNSRTDKPTMKTRALAAADFF